MAKRRSTKRTLEGIERRRIRGQARRLEKKGFSSWRFQPEILRSMSLEELKAITTADINMESKYEGVLSYQYFQENTRQKERIAFYREGVLPANVQAHVEEEKFKREWKIDWDLEREHQRQQDEDYEDQFGTFEPEDDEEEEARERARREREERAEEYDRRVTDGKVKIDRLYEITGDYFTRFANWIMGEIDYAIENLGEDIVAYFLSTMPESVVEHIQKVLTYETTGETAIGYVQELVTYLRAGEKLSDEDLRVLQGIADSDEDGEDYMV